MTDRSPHAPEAQPPAGASLGRRRFLTRSATAAVAASPAWSFMIVPRHVLGGEGHVPPSERINLAGVGAGGMGGGDIATFAKLGANVVALCDVDDERARVRRDPRARREPARVGLDARRLARNTATRSRSMPPSHARPPVWMRPMNSRAAGRTTITQRGTR